MIEGQGLIDSSNVTFLYLKPWSEKSTWSERNDVQIPIEGTTVTIPMMKEIIFDLDTSPILGDVIVEGSLIFMPDKDRQHTRYFNARSIIVKNGGVL